MISKKSTWAILFTYSIFFNTSYAETTNTEPTHSLANTANLIPAFTAKYHISRNGDVIGKASRSLKYLSPTLAEYSYKTDLEWLIFSDRRKETSTVRLDKGQLTPSHYRFTREGTGSDKAYEWAYDIDKKIATNILKKKTLEIDYPANIQDKLSYHLQNRLNLITDPNSKSFTYPVISTSGKIKDYHYQYDGKEELMLPYGLVKTVRFKREVPSKEKATYAWFAPKLSYLLVKLRLEKEGVEQFQAELDSYSPEK